MTEKLTITQDGRERELFMSYGLLNVLSIAVGSPELVPSMSLDDQLRGEVLAAVLAERKVTGKVIKPVEDLDDIDVSIDDVEAILDWAGEHLMGFFMRRLAKSAKHVEKHKDLLVGLKSSMDGLQGLASATA
ncbi:hypothetical protein ACCS91_33440 [Rhizobium ruizarguesonis]